MKMPNETAPIVIVGGGIAGLATAAYLARSGRSAVVLERSQEPGGRAQTTHTKGFDFNLGPHALYGKGAARRVLDELRVPLSGHHPASTGSFAIQNGVRHVLPTGAGSLLRTSLLDWRSKLEVLRILSTLPKLETRRYASMTVRQWLERELANPAARGLMEALFRLATYANAPDQMGAAEALQQLQLAATGNVLYLDRGWQTIVDGLLGAARAAGARIETRASVVEVSRRRVTLADGRELTASAVILAVEPAEVSRLTGAELDFTPVRAACLDVALERAPDPNANFAIGIDEPLYLSRHTAAAKLAPLGKDVIHVARYLAPGESAGVESLERLLDVMQPGWRDVTVESRFLPQMTVSHEVVPPGGRTLDVDELAGSGIYLVGDWVGPEGMLADAALASARRVAERLGAAEVRQAA